MDAHSDRATPVRCQEKKWDKLEPRVQTTTGGCKHVSSSQLWEDAQPVRAAVMTAAAPATVGGIEWMSIRRFWGPAMVRANQGAGCGVWGAAQLLEAPLREARKKIGIL